MGKNLIWFGPVYSYSGYATHNRYIVTGLKKLGWNIQLFPTERDIPDDLQGKQELLEMTKNNSCNPEETIAINLIPPPAIPHYAGYTILYTTLESKTVHQGYMKRCTLFDEVWLPCIENMRSMVRAGFPRKNLFYCPEGVDRFRWTPAEQKHEKYASDKYTFFYNGDWSYRKGMDILFRAYAKAFNKLDQVRLLLLVHYQGNGPEESGPKIFQELDYYMIKYNIPSFPHIDFIFDMIPDRKLPSIYNCADVYVSPTRGEAWGLPIIQAMSCGIPPIIPEWGGHRDYCNRNNSLLIKCNKFDIMDDKVNLTVDFYQGQKFTEPDVNDLAEKMRWAYKHRIFMKNLGQLARKYVTEKFPWEEACKKASDRLEEIYESRNFTSHT